MNPRNFSMAILCLILIPLQTFAEIDLSYSTLWTRQIETNNNPAGIGWSDLNNDGLLDLILSNGLDQVSVANEIFYNTDTGLSTIPGWSSAEAYASGNLYTGDYNNDGLTDFIVSNLGEGQIGFPPIPHQLYLNSPDGFSASASWESPPANAFSCTSGDPDGDGDLDLVFAQACNSAINPDWTRPQKLVMFLNNNGSFNDTPDWESDSSFLHTDAAFVDVDRDGDLDLAASGKNMGVYIYYNNNGQLDTYPSWTLETVDGVRQLDFGDVNNDGYDDLVVASISGNFYLFLNESGTISQTSAWMGATYSQPSCVALGDADGDGDLDLAAGGWYSYVGVFENIGGNFSTEYAWKYNCSGYSYFTAQQVAWADYDNDGLISATKQFTGNGTTSLFYLEQKIVHQLISVSVDNVILPYSEYCYDNINGWISLKTPPAMGSLIDIDYTYSIDLDLTINMSTQTLLEHSMCTIFENHQVADTSDPQILLFAPREYGTNYNIDDLTLSIRDQMERFGWDLTVIGNGTSVNPCPVGASVYGNVPFDLDKNYRDVAANIKKYDCLTLLPTDNAYQEIIDDQEFIDFINLAHDSGLIIACWCRAITVLAEADLLDGIKVATHADYEQLVTDAGGIYMGDNIPPIVQGNIITSVRSSFYRTEMCETTKLMVDVNRGDIVFFPDNFVGQPPLEVNFEGRCGKPVNSWLYDFGDGLTSTEQSPNHIFNQRGTFDVSLTCDVEGVIKNYTYERCVVAYNDTLRPEPVSCEPGDTIEIPVYAFNSAPLTTISIPVSVSGTLPFQIILPTTKDCRTEAFETVSYSHYDPFNKRFTCYLKAGTGIELPPGEGLLIKIRLVISKYAQIGQTLNINLDGYMSSTTPYMPIFGGPLVTYTPSNLNTTVTAESCCIGIRGNIDGDDENVIDIADLVFFINYALYYPARDIPECLREADVDGSGVIEIMDVVYMVDYVLRSPQGPAPINCY